MSEGKPEPDWVVLTDPLGITGVPHFTEGAWVDRSRHRSPRLRIPLNLAGDQYEVAFDEFAPTTEFQTREDGAVAQVLRYEGAFR